MLDVFATNLEFVFILTVFAVSALAYFGIRHSESTFYRLAALSLTLLLFCGSWFVYSGLLSNPKPITLSWIEKAVLEDKDVYVISFATMVDKQIYLWLQIPGRESPAYYSIPWNGTLAKSLYEAQRKAQETNARVRLKNLFNRDTNKIRPELVLPKPSPKNAPPGSKKFIFKIKVQK